MRAAAAAAAAKLATNAEPALRERYDRWSGSRSGRLLAIRLARQIQGRYSEGTIIAGTPHHVVWKDGVPLRRSRRRGPRAAARAARLRPAAAEGPTPGAAAAYKALARPARIVAMAENERRPRMPTRSTPPEQPEGGGRRRMQMPRPRFIVIVLVLLAVNYLSVALFAPGKERSIGIPYNPTFLRQVEADNVERDLRARARRSTASSRTRSSTRRRKAQAGQELRDRDPDVRQHRRAVQAAAGPQGRRSRPRRSTTAAGSWRA